MNFHGTVGHIPARGGSERVPAKNLRFIAGRPLLAWSVAAALDAEVLDEVVVNTDSDEIAALAEELGAGVYRRRPELATATASGDDFNADFIAARRPQTLVMINPVCPLVLSEDVRAAVEDFHRSDCDTLITCSETRLQTFCDGEAVNIDVNGPLAPTQDNPPVQILNWAVTVWDGPAFLQAYESSGSGYIGSRRRLLPLDPVRGIKISVEADFRLAEMCLQARELGEAPPPRYWRQAGA